MLNPTSSSRYGLRKSSSFATGSQHLYTQATTSFLEDAMGCRNEKPTTDWGTITASTIVVA